MEQFLEELSKTSIVWFLIVLFYAVRMFTTYRKETIDSLLFRHGKHIGILTWCFLLCGVLSLLFFIAYV